MPLPSNMPITNEIEDITELAPVSLPIPLDEEMKDVTEKMDLPILSELTEKNTESLDMDVPTESGSDNEQLKSCFKGKVENVIKSSTEGHILVSQLDNIILRKETAKKKDLSKILHSIEDIEVQDITKTGSNPLGEKAICSKDSMNETKIPPNENDVQGSSQSLGPRTYGPTKRFHSRACCNEICVNTTDEVITAPSHVLFYFGVVTTDASRRHHKICTPCLEQAEDYIANCIGAIEKKESIYDIPCKFRCVTTIDLDEESDSGSDEDTILEVSKNIEEDIDKVVKIYDMTDIVSKCIATLDKDMDELDECFKELIKGFQETEQEMENARKGYDNLTGPKFNHVALKSLDIDEFGHTRELPANPTFIQKSPRKQPRKPQLIPTETATNNDAEIFELPPMGPPPPVRRACLAATPTIIPRIMPKIRDKVFLMRNTTLNLWVPGEILDVNFGPPIEFKVRFESKGVKYVSSTSKEARHYQIKTLSPKQIAYNLPCPFLLPVSTRVIARFRDVLKTEPYGNGNYYAGIVAEPPKSQNNYRYLIFFDDGYAQYVGQEEVFLVCEASKDVWMDVHPDSQNFIMNYVKDYPERPMLRLQRGGVVTTEYESKWLIARVVEVDASLVKMCFESDNRCEWIYRGSTRLSPLYHKMRRQSNVRRHNFSTARSGNSSTIEYTYGIEDVVPENGNRVAKKSTSAGSIAHSNGSTRKQQEMSSNSLLEYEGKMVKVGVPKSVAPSSTYINHKCGPSCVRAFDENSEEFKTLNPLSIPMWLGFTRISNFREVGKTPRRTIYYRTPCGHRVRDYNDLQRYLVQTDYNMGIDYFCFDFVVDCLSEFMAARLLHAIPDITYGKEVVKVQCVNSIDHDYPDYVDYTRERIPSKDVNVNLDEEFLTCCDCEDDCLDQSKCSCWKMTLEGRNSCGLPTAPGYQNKRLYSHIISGIYECNQRCNCKKTCSNRVAQNPMRWQLQVFKTSTKGWAIRPLHDIPCGAFICVYAGQLLTDQGANEKADADEFLAELDLIEVMEGVKDGYEQHVIEPFVPREVAQHSSQESTSDDSDDEEEDGHADDKDYIARTISLERTISTRRSDTCSKDDEIHPQRRNTDEDIKNELEDSNEQRQPSKFAANFALGADSADDGEHRVSTRALFGPDEQCYIMDAKRVGNIGRYLNHSCQPNVFVQNVFVDTHDLRFPWVAFFASKHIRAGTELTWDYNYDIGSVPDKTMYCYCGTPDCRGRLL